MGNFLPSKQCTDSDTYDAGRNARDDLLENKVGLIEWYTILKENNFHGYCSKVKPIPTKFYEIYLKDDSINSDDDYQVSKKDI